MGSLSNSSMFIEGRLAGLVYVSLYNMHQFSVYGWRKELLVLLSRKLSNIVGPKLKLHENSSALKKLDKFACANLSNFLFTLTFSGSTA
jgi:hypothetical protein